MGFWLVVVLAVAVGGTLFYLQWQREQKRRSLLVEWAMANKWTFAARDDQWCVRWQGPPFSEGDHRRACNVLTGEWKGKPFASFDYTYETHSSDSKGGRSTTTHRYAVTSVQLPTYLPRLQVTPESVFSRLGSAIGISPDIELESEDFNRAFRVHANDPKFASDVLTPPTMQMLLARPHFSWRIEGSDIVCWEQGEQEPAEVTARVATMLDVVAGIPSFVWHDNGLGDGTTNGPTAVGGTS